MTTHLLHYLGAVVLLAAGGWMTAVFLLQQRSRWQLDNSWRMAVWACCLGWLPQAICAWLKICRSFTGRR